MKNPRCNAPTTKRPTRTANRQTIKYDEASYAKLKEALEALKKISDGSATEQYFIWSGSHWRLAGSNVVVGPFASFDYLNQAINHGFPGGTFLGTTPRWVANAGVKAGIATSPNLYLYGLAAAAFLNQDLDVNFATAASSNVTTPGVTVGAGAEFRSSWQLAGHPISLFAQYQHTWWDTAHFDRPASSPAFNYGFRREGDTVKLGVNLYFNPAPPPRPALPSYPVKALAQK